MGEAGRTELQLGSNWQYVLLGFQVMDDKTVVDFPKASSGYAARVAANPVIGVVERLEELLEKAKKGEIRSFVAATVLGPGVTASVWAETDGWFHEITSGLAMLQFRWMCENSGYTPK